MSYTKEIRFKDNELPATINVETGEIQEIRSRPNNIPDGKQLWNPGPFSKSYTAAWDYLFDNLTDKEVVIVVKMRTMIRPNSNSLAPLSNSSSIEEIANTFNVHRNSVKKMFTKLLKFGVYAEFKFGSKTGIKHYWVLNPYLAFKGRTIDKCLADLFRETVIAEIVTNNPSFY